MDGPEKRIRIVDIPPGQAPEWVRKEWIGLELPAAKPRSLFQIGVKFGPPSNLGGYQVDAKTAIDVLREKSPKAAEWWDGHLPKKFDWLIFKKDVCEEVIVTPKEALP